MKLFLFYIFSISTFSAYCQNFSKVKASLDSTYRYSIENPLPFNKGNNGKSLDYSLKFLSMLYTADGQKLLLIKRNTVNNPDYNGQKTFSFLDKRTRLSLNHKQGPLDKYFYIAETTKDSIVLLLIFIIMEKY